MITDRKKMLLEQWGIKRLVLVLMSCLFLLTGSLSEGAVISSNKSNSCRTLRSMARVYMAYGDYIKAQPLVEQALALARANSVPESELCWCLIDLAFLYKSQGKFDDAERLC